MFGRGYRSNQFVQHHKQRTVRNGGRFCFSLFVCFPVLLHRHAHAQSRKLVPLCTEL